MTGTRLLLLISAVCVLLHSCCGSRIVSPVSMHISTPIYKHIGTGVTQNITANLSFVPPCVAVDPTPGTIVVVKALDCAVDLAVSYIYKPGVLAIFITGSNLNTEGMLTRVPSRYVFGIPVYDIHYKVYDYLYGLNSSEVVVEVGSDANPWDSFFDGGMWAIQILFLIAYLAVLIYIIINLTGFVVNCKIIINLKLVCNLILMVSSILGIMTFLDPLHSRGLYSDTAETVLVTITQNSSLVACLLITVYWGDLIYKKKSIKALKSATFFSKNRFKLLSIAVVWSFLYLILEIIASFGVLPSFVTPIIQLLGSLLILSIYLYVCIKLIGTLKSHASNKTLTSTLRLNSVIAVVIMMFLTAIFVAYGICFRPNFGKLTIPLTSFLYLSLFVPYYILIWMILVVFRSKASATNSNTTSNHSSVGITSARREDHHSK